MPEKNKLYYILYTMPSKQSNLPKSTKRVNTMYSKPMAKPKKRQDIQRYRPVASKLGAYRISGGIYGQGAIGPFKAGAQLSGAYSSSASGLGAYNISNIHHNTLIKPDIPQMRNSIYAEGGTIIRHREYLGPITTSPTAGAFKIQTYPLNPAQSSTFPWLSTIAQNYEEYRPNGMLFEFRSTASDAIASSSNLALGQVMLCTQYDPTDPDFNNDIELLNYTWAQSGKVSDNIMHFVECDPGQSPLSHLYCRSGAVGSDTDLRFSDFGKFSIATSGLQGTNVQVGQLWVSYEFICYKPKIGSNGQNVGEFFHSGNEVGLNAISLPFGTISSMTYDPENTLAIQASNSPLGADRGRLTFPVVAVKASYMITLTVIGSADTANCGFFRAGASSPEVQFVQHLYGDSLAAFGSPKVLGTFDRIIYIMFANINPSSTPCFIDFETEGIYPTGAKLDIYVSQVPYLDPAIYG